MKNNKTKQKIIDTAFQLFHSKGFKATGIDEILQASETGKGQFYYYFKNKDDLVHHVLQDFSLKLQSDEFPLIKEINTWKDLKNWFYFFINFQKQTGCQRSCPVGTIAGELDSDEKLIRKDACEIFDYARKPLTHFFQQKIKQGEISKSHKPKALTDLCYAIIQGGLLISKIEQNVTPFENAVKEALKYLQSLKIK